MKSAKIIWYSENLTVRTNILDCEMVENQLLKYFLCINRGDLAPLFDVCSALLKSVNWLTKYQSIG